MKVKNIHYRKFIDEGIIDTLTDEQIQEALANIKGKYQRQGRALLIALYYTGARPGEVLQIRAKDITKIPRYLLIKVVGIKRGLPRTLYFPINRPMIKELWKYAQGMPFEMYLFFAYRSRSKREYIKKNGEISTIYELSHKLRYHFNNWFKGVMEQPIPPYFLRHNRFSTFAEKGASIQDIQMFKGSKRPASVMPYLHLTSKTSKKLSRMV